MSESMLSHLIKRISDPDYSTIEELVASSAGYSTGEIRDFLNHVVEAWMANEITAAMTNELLKFAYIYLDQPGIQIDFKNRTSIPVCIYSPYPSLSASFLHSYLKTLSFAVTLFSLAETDRHLREFIRKSRPPTARAI